MRVILDGFGGDHSPDEVIKGARLAKDEFGFDIALSGSEEKLRAAAQRLGVSLDGIGIVEAPDVVTMEDAPVEVIRSKSSSSMAVGLRTLAEGNGDAFVSAGSTGALVVGARTIVHCLPGLRRAAFAPILPSNNGCYMLLDGGANAECRPEMLVHFAHMGSIYMEKIMHIEKPRVGLANIGVEDHKGTDLQRSAYQMLKASPLNFIGNVEGRDIPMGVCDVVIADGFTGNIILKLTEGLGLALAGNIKAIFKRNAITMAAALLVSGGLRDFKKKFDYTEYGGAPLMGIARPVIKAHGSSNAVAFKNAVRQAGLFVSENVNDAISGSLPSKGQDAQ